MPKGRGSNKTGGGPTPPQERPQQVQQGIPPHVELLVTKNQLSDALVQTRQLQAQVEQLTRMVMAVLLTKKGNTATIKPSQVEKLVGFSGFSVDENEDESVTLSLVEVPDDSAE